MTTHSFPAAQQAQIIRANQRDIIHVSTLREQTETVLRAWKGTRWLTRWEREVAFLVNIGYYGLTTGRATQTLGEEYTDIWQYSFRANKPPSAVLRAALILLPTLPPYVLARWGSALSSRSPWAKKALTLLAPTFQILSEINLAIFYLRGTYYHAIKRLLGIRHISSIPENPHTRPPSYSLLGVLIAVRLLHRLVMFIRAIRSSSQTTDSKGKSIPSREHEFYLDDRPVSYLVTVGSEMESEPARPAEEDERTMLDISSIPTGARSGRNCTLCLEERTDSCATECGHLFCWSCIVGWGREKAECPLCRQSLSLIRLLPIYNL